MDILGTIEAMEHEGYPADAILATIRGRLEAERLAEDCYWSDMEADRAARAKDDRRRLAALVGTTAAPF
jgi:hypothetical protein